MVLLVPHVLQVYFGVKKQGFALVLPDLLVFLIWFSVCRSGFNCQALVGLDPIRYPLKYRGILVCQIL
jgi:hypothetical protein